MFVVVVTEWLLMLIFISQDVHQSPPSHPVYSHHP